MEEHEEVIAVYEGMNPTLENYSACIKEVANQLEMSPNKVRIILRTAGVLPEPVVEAQAKIEQTKVKSGKEKAPRRTKADDIADLASVISEIGLEVNEEILGKLTGKAAVYFRGVIEGIRSIYTATATIPVESPNVTDDNVTSSEDEVLSVELIEIETDTDLDYTNIDHEVEFE